MPSHRLVILLLLLAAAFAAVLAAAPAARRQSTPPSAVPAGSNAGSTFALGARTAGEAWVPDGTARLEAVRTVKLFCDLVDARRFWEAAGLFASQRVWTRAELRAVRALSFRSARVFTVPDHATVTVTATVRAVARPGSPVPPGAATLFFTLGRVGTTDGGWVIQAVTARPQPQRKGSP